MIDGAARRQPALRDWTARADDDYGDRAARAAGPTSPTSSPSTRSGSPTRPSCAPRGCATRSCGWPALLGYEPAPGRRRHGAARLRARARRRSSSCRRGLRVQERARPGRAAADVRDRRAARGARAAQRGCRCACRRAVDRSPLDGRRRRGRARAAVDAVDAARLLGVGDRAPALRRPARRRSRRRRVIGVAAVERRTGRRPPLRAAGRGRAPAPPASRARLLGRWTRRFRLVRLRRAADVPPPVHDGTGEVPVPARSTQSVRRRRDPAYHVRRRRRPRSFDLDRRGGRHRAGHRLLIVVAGVPTARRDGAAASATVAARQGPARRRP